MGVETLEPTEQNMTGPKSCKDLENEYRQKPETEWAQNFQEMKFEGLDLNELIRTFSPIDSESEEPRQFIVQITFYNPTPFNEEGKEMVAVRIEPLDRLESISMFFEVCDDGICRPIEGVPSLKGIEDPKHLGEIDGWKVITGVYSWNKGNNFQGVFYRYKDNLSELEEFARGPEGQKGARLLDHFLFTRRRDEDGTGHLYNQPIDSLENLPEALKGKDVREIPGLYRESEWGGVNDLVMLEGGFIGVIGHHARIEDGKKYYYATAFVYDPAENEAFDYHIICSPEDVPTQKIPKNEEIGGVIYSGGISARFEQGGRSFAHFYIGFNDTTPFRCDIPWPFHDREGNELGAVSKK